jgi:hypothetical protein
MKEQSQKHATKHTKVGCYLKVTLVYKGLRWWWSEVYLQRPLTTKHKYPIKEEQEDGLSTGQNIQHT